MDCMQNPKVKPICPGVAMTELIREDDVGPKVAIHKLTVFASVVRMAKTFLTTAVYMGATR